MPDDTRFPIDQMVLVFNDAEAAAMADHPDTE